MSVPSGFKLPSRKTLSEMAAAAGGRLALRAHHVHTLNQYALLWDTNDWKLEYSLGLADEVLVKITIKGGEQLVLHDTYSQFPSPTLMAQITLLVG